MDMVITIRRLSRGDGAPGEPADFRVRSARPPVVAELAERVAAMLGMPSAHLVVGSVALAHDHVVGQWPLVHGAEVIAAGTDSVGTARPVSRDTPFDLVVTSGPDGGRRVPLSHNGIVIGRGLSCTLPVHDDALSREHARIEVTPSALLVHDLGSTNGTRVGAATVREGSPAAVTTEDLLGVGRSRLALRRAPLPAPSPQCRDGRRLGRWTPPPPAPPPVVRVDLPRAPAPSDPAPVPWVTMLVPLPIAAVLAVAFGPQYLLFAALGPLTSGATWWQDRRRRRRGDQLARAQHALAEDAAAARLREALHAEVEALEALAPDPDTVLCLATSGRRGRARPLAPDAGDRWPTGLPVRLGIGDPESLRVSTARAGVGEPAPRLLGAPVVVDLAIHRRLELVGHRSRTTAVLRQVVGGLAVRHSATDLQFLVVGEGRGPELEWLRWLPHTSSVTVPVSPPADEAPAPAHKPRWTLLVQLGRGNLRLEAIPPGRDPFPDQSPRGLVLYVGAETDELADGAGSRLPLVADGVGPWWAHRLARAVASTTAGDTEAGGDEDVSPLAGLGRPLSDLTEAPGLVSAAVARQWQERAPEQPVRAVVGEAGAGPWALDLDADGPHLLVAGTTGSGKSEVLRSLLTGLALIHPPEEVTFLLVDYKGGSTFTSAQRLPHTVGVVSDLDPGLADRALRSLRAEVRRREHLLAGSGSTSLAEHGRRGHEPLPRLVVVVDEFRVLAQEFPAFLDGLVRVATVGRSMGIHLVLATQRPAGAVTADIQANMGTRLALRMRDPHESSQVIDDPVAATIAPDRPGSGYARGADGTLAAFRAFHLSAPAPRPCPGLRVDPLAPSELPAPAGADSSGEGPTVEELIALAVCRAHRQGDRALPRRPWLTPLPVRLHADDLEPDDGAGAIALVDRPDQQAQSVLHWRPSDPPLRVLGGAASGRSTALATIASAASTALGDGLQVHAVGNSPTLVAIGSDPAVASVIGPHETGRLRRLVERVRRHGAALGDEGHLLLLLDDWDALVAPGVASAPLVETLVREAAAARPAVSIAAAGGRALATTRLLARGTTVCLGGLDVGDLLVLGLRPDALGSETVPGRGVVLDSGDLAQFALPSLPVRRSRVRRWQPVEDLPETVSVDDLLAPEVSRPTDGERAAYRPLLGVGGADIAPVHWDPEVDGCVLLVCGPAGSGRTGTLSLLAEQARAAGMPVVRLGAGPWWAAGSGRRLVVVDDIDSIGPEGEAALSALLGQDGECLLAVSARQHTVATAFRGAVPQVVARGCAVVLQPSSSHDGDAFGVRLEPAAARVPGRGVFVRRGRADELQVACVATRGSDRDVVLRSA